VSTARAIAAHAFAVNARTALLWGLAFDAVVVASLTAYTAAYPTAADREAFAATLSSSRGLSVLFGTPHQLDTVGGFTAWRSLGLVSLIGAGWGLIAATRATRGEEEAGRWELVRAGPLSARAATLATGIGLVATLGLLYAVVAAACLAAGPAAADLPISACLYFALALVASAAVFAAVGLLAGQLAATRRQATAIAAGVFGVSFLLRVVAGLGDDPQQERNPEHAGRDGRRLPAGRRELAGQQPHRSEDRGTRDER